MGVKVSAFESCLDLSGDHPQKATLGPPVTNHLISIKKDTLITPEILIVSGTESQEPGIKPKRSNVHILS